MTYIDLILSGCIGFGIIFLLILIVNMNCFDILSTVQQRYVQCNASSVVKKVNILKKSHIYCHDGISTSKTLHTF